MSSDNRSNDPSVQLVGTERSAEGEKTIVPVVGSLPGAFGSMFKTAVQLHNPTDAELRGHVVFHPAERSDVASDVSFDHVLAPRQTMGWEDLPASIGAQGLGSLGIGIFIFRSQLRVERRGICPSCGAKRAAETAARLREDVLEPVGHAQWVFTVPKMLRPYFLRQRGERHRAALR